MQIFSDAQSISIKGSKSPASLLEFMRLTRQIMRRITSIVMYDRNYCNDTCLFIPNLFPNLVYLALIRTHINAKNASKLLQKLPKLEKIDFRFPQTKLNYLKHIGSNIEDITFRVPRFEDFDSMSPAGSVRYVRVITRLVTGFALVQLLHSMPNVQKMVVATDSFCNFPDFTSFYHLSKLSTLCFNCSVVDEFDKNARMPSVKSLKLFDEQLTNNISFEEVLEIFPNVEILKFPNGEMLFNSTEAISSISRIQVKRIKLKFEFKTKKSLMIKIDNEMRNELIEVLTAITHPKQIKVKVTFHKKLEKEYRESVCAMRAVEQAKNGKQDMNCRMILCSLK
ncbi:hypothetical protein B4U80_14314 [Leptotrombidium deliense]|uniref:Uncharacterized protein n=1 Tax=Leptotrombidium deliense TaxID=299467 RepID=A0A443RY37_9ACAR|nr:hypothetical protein B4U80_14314 [Leptotrombidium deliense]